MQEALIVRGRYINGSFIPDSPLPDGEGTAELIITPTPTDAKRSIADAFGKATILRSKDDILGQVRLERDEWGDR